MISDFAAAERSGGQRTAAAFETSERRSRYHAPTRPWL